MSENGLSLDFQGLRSVAALADNTRTWKNAFRGDIADLAIEWFGPPAYNTSDAFRLISPEDGLALAEQGDWMANATIGRAFALVPTGLERPYWDPSTDELVPLSQTSATDRILRASRTLGYPVAAYEHVFVTRMSTAAGGVLVHMAEIRRSTRGQEYLYWFTSPVVSLGMLPDNSVASIGMVAAIPALLQSLAYLAECPTPTTALFRAGLFNRAEAFGLERESVAPARCTRLWLGNGQEPFYACTDQATGLIEAFWTDARVDHGVAISLDADDQSLANALLTSIESSAKLTAMVESGYLNYPDGDFGFQRALMAQAAWTVVDRQRWIPPSLPSEVISTFSRCQ